MSQNKFWESLARGHAASTYPSSLDVHLSGAPEEKFTSVRSLTESGRRAGALQLPVSAGTMVVFAGDLGSMLSMQNPPPKGMPGEVISVKSAGGELTSHEGMVFVKWADGQLRSVHAEYLRIAKLPKEASSPETEEAEIEGACWKGYEAFGFKEKDGKKVPNCIPVKKSSGKKDINPYAKDHTFETFKKKYFKGDPDVPPSVAKEFWDDFRYSYVGSLGSYIKDTTENRSNGNPRLARTIRLTSLGDLSQFLKTADGKLVHKSTKDLWSFKKDADGTLVVERMFDDTGKPLKA